MRTWLAILCLLVARSGLPAEPEAFDLPPQIKVEVGAHTSFIKKLAVSADGSWLLSVSDDRTARIWNARTGVLQRTLRVPIGLEGEGKLAAAAFTPDGRFAVVGGFSGLTRGPDAGAVVYFFDARNGQLVAGIDTGAPFAIDNLEFSGDGAVLAICQADGQGVRFYDWRHGQQLHQDLAPGDKILGADFSGNGDFALTTVDGWLRVYSAASGYRESRALQLAAGRTPMHVKFAADSRMLAVGFDGDPVVSIVDVASLQEMRVLRAADPRQTGLHVVEWSADGAAILAGGETTDAGYTPIYRFMLDGSAPPGVIATLGRRVSDLRRLQGGGYAFSSGEPEVGVADGNGRIAWRSGAGTVLGDPARDHISTSVDGAQVTFRSATAAREWQFDIARDLQDIVTSRLPTPSAAQPPAAPGIPTELAGDRMQLRVAGREVPLHKGERVNYLTEDAPRQRLLIGTGWSLRLVDAQGRQLWRWSAPEEALQSVIAAGGQVAVTFLADGTLRWNRLADGAEVLALLPHRNGVDWVAWIPDGYYMSSTAGDNLVGWQLNNGMAATPDFYRAVQFERVFYRPDIVRAHFRTLGRESAGAAEGVHLADLRSIAPPKLSISVLEQSPTRGTARVRVSGARSALPIRDWALFVDGIPVTPKAARALAGEEAASFVREFEVPLFSATSLLRAEAFNGTSLGLAEETVESASVATEVSGRLFIAAVGIANYADPAISDLTYPPRDAEEFADLYARLGRQMFSEVRTLKLTDDAELKPVGANLRRIESFLADATGADTVVLFLASHGFSDKAGNYYFLPQDARYADVESVLDGRRDGGSLIGWQFFFDLLRGTAGRRLLIVDTCSSGNVGGTFDVHSLAKRSMASSFGLLTASAGSELSQEKASLQHGIFTYGLLQALETHGAGAAARPLLVRDAFQMAFETTRREHVASPDNPTQTPQRVLPAPLETMAMLPANVITQGGTASGAL